MQTGWCLAKMGRIDDGLMMIIRGLENCLKAQIYSEMTLYYGMLAEVYFLAGSIQDALASLTKGLTLANSNGEHFWAAELHRLVGEYHSARGDSPITIERHFQQALSISKRQEAKSLELRAATSMAKFLKLQDRSAEAIHLLEPIYAGFTEGFDTHDLSDAKALLVALATAVRS